MDRRLSLPEPRHLAGLDLLRGAAILLVLLFHYPRQDAPALLDAIAGFGWTGVELFFVLSGFLIGSQLLEPVARGETLSLGRFYLRRSLRILPSFLAVLGLYLLVPAWAERPVHTPAWRFLTFTQNFGLRTGDGFSHAWSLCVEEHFYLTLPLAVLALRGRLRGGQAVLGVGLVMLCGALVRGSVWMHQFGSPDVEPSAWRGYNTFLYYPTYARLDGLLCGVLLALVRVFRPALWESALRSPGRFAALGLAFVGAAAWLDGAHTKSLAATVLAFPLVALGFAAWVVAMASPGASRLCARLPGVRALATLSFALYLTHKAAWHGVHELLAPHGFTPLHPVTVLACIPVVLATAWVLHQCIERPGLRLRAFLERRVPLSLGPGASGTAG